MLSNFDHLLNLARKTGNNLIIYDFYSNRNLVILRVDEYERLVDMDIGLSEYNGGEAVCEMSEVELLDKINRDIAAWRAYQEKEDYETREEMLEEELANDHFDPFNEDYSHNNDWHSAGEVLREEHPKFSSSEFTSGIIFPSRSLSSETVGNNYQSVSLDDPYRSSLGRSVPYEEHTNDIESASEPFGDEPIFFEEPIE